MTKYITTFQYRRLNTKIRALEESLANASHQVGEAADFGDVIENFEFEAAIQNEQLISRQLSDLVSQLEGCEIVDPMRINPERARIGTSVKVKDLSDGIVKTFNLVGVGPINSNQGEVSYLSPTGAALLAAITGETRVITLPNRRIEYQIMGIERYNPSD